MAVFFNGGLVQKPPYQSERLTGKYDDKVVLTNVVEFAERRSQPWLHMLEGRPEHKGQVVFRKQSVREIKVEGSTDTRQQSLSDLVTRSRNV